MTNNPYTRKSTQFLTIPETNSLPDTINMDELGSIYVADKTNEGYVTAINKFNLFAKDQKSLSYNELTAEYLADNYESLLEHYTRWLLQLKKDNEKFYQPKTIKQYYSGFNQCIANDSRFKKLIRKMDMSWLEGKTDALEMRAWTASVERGESSANSTTSIRRSVASNFIKWYLYNASNKNIEKDATDVWQNW